MRFLPGIAEVARVQDVFDEENAVFLVGTLGAENKIIDLLIHILRYNFTIEEDPWACEEVEVGTSGSSKKFSTIAGACSFV